MNKKSIIQIIVIIIAFSGSGFVLYNGMLKKKPVTLSVSGVPRAVMNEAPVDKILPYGNTLDFDAVLKRNSLQFGTLSFPRVATATEVGVLAQDLIQVLPAAK